MDALLSRLGVQAMNYAIRSGIALTSTYAISQCSRLLRTVEDKSAHSELRALQRLLDTKIKVHLFYFLYRMVLSSARLTFDRS